MKRANSASNNDEILQQLEAESEEIFDESEIINLMNIEPNIESDNLPARSSPTFDFGQPSPDMFNNSDESFQLDAEEGVNDDGDFSETIIQNDARKRKRTEAFRKTNMTNAGRKQDLLHL